MRSTVIANWKNFHQINLNTVEWTVSKNNLISRAVLRSGMNTNTMLTALPQVSQSARNRSGGNQNTSFSIRHTYLLMTNAALNECYGRRQATNVSLLNYLGHLWPAPIPDSEYPEHKVKIHHRLQVGPTTTYRGLT